MIIRPRGICNLSLLSAIGIYDPYIPVAASVRSEDNRPAVG